MMNRIEKKLQAILNAQIGKGHIHSIVAAVQSQDRKIDFVGAAGIADPISMTAMTPDSPYFIASVTKMFTAAIIMELYEKNKLDLDAPISKYLPDSLIHGIHIYKGTDFSGQIKVSELVNQSSGLADYETDKLRGEKSVLDELKNGYDRSISTIEAIEVVRRFSPHFSPGTRGKAYYSNLNYRLLGLIIESITGQSMALNFEEMICAPLGLKHTYLFDCTVPPRDQVLSAIYLQDRPANIYKYLSSNVSDGGIISTAPEIMIFIRAFFEGRLFNKEFFNFMMNWNPLFFPLRYGYGLMYFHLPRYFWITPLPEFIGHSGTTGSFAFICPSRSLYLTGTVNLVSPSKPYFLMIDLVHAVS